MSTKCIIFCQLFIILQVFTSCSSEKKNIDETNVNSLELQKYYELKELAIKIPVLKDSILKEIYLLNNDSLKVAAVFDITYKFYKKDSLHFRFWNKTSFEISQKIKDTSRIAEAHWDLGNFFYQVNILDSSYFHYNKAFINYEIIGHDFQSARMMLNLAMIQKDIKDYLGSEVLLINAIEKLKPLKKNEQLFSAYNYLGIINNELKEYSKSLEYHAKALSIVKILKDPVLKATSFNNIGVVKRNQGKHQEAMNNYRNAIMVDSLFFKNSRLYAMVIDNYAYSKFKSVDTIGVEEMFKKALRIRKNVDHISGIVTSKLHLGEFYLDTNRGEKAMHEFTEAANISRTFNLNSELLESLLHLARFNDPMSSTNYSEYIKLNDSLQRNERLVRNKFARIRFETDEFIAQNDQLNVQKKWIIAGFTGVILFLISISVILILKRKNKELKLIQLQQKANEDIYNLMIESQTNIERGQEQEKKRISKELHDGILSQFFGVRLNLELLNDRIDQNSVVKREKYIKELKALETEIRKVSHQLNSDLVSSDVSFINILQDLLKEQGNLGGYNGLIDFEGSIEWEKISPKIKINLFRIIQEALHNIYKYAEADNVKIVFKNVQGKLLVVIEDDGKGFEVENSHNGIGISNMKSRIYDLNGQLSIFSNHTGTQISLNIPLKNELHESKNPFN